MNQIVRKVAVENSPSPIANSLGSDRHEFAVRTVMAVGIAILLAAGVFLLWWARSVFFLLFAGVVFGVFLHGISEWVRIRTNLPYYGSLGLVVVLLLAVLGLVGWLMGQEIASQFSQLAESLPLSFQQLQGQLEEHPWGRWLVEKAEDGTEFSGGRGIISRVTGIVGGLLNGLTALIVIGFVGLYAAIEPNYYRKGVLHLVPKKHRGRGEDVLNALDNSLLRWLKAIILSMLIVGVLTTLGLSLLGVPMALALGLLAMSLEGIPNLGPLLASVPATLVAWSHGGDNLALQTAGLFLGIQMLESYVILPLLQRETVYLPPILSVIAVVFFGAIGGILGAFVAAPLLVVLMVLVKLLYIEDALNDHTVKESIS